jgi:sec-independent protein translocase protein TatA
MFGIGSSELLIILLLVFVLFGGGKKIPELFSGLGKGIRSFKKSLNEDDPEENTATKKEQIDHKS